MRIEVNGVRLFFDVEGAKLVPDGPTMREKPTLIYLHGGPGMDHSIAKPAFSRLADVAQIVYIDHRGNGRSEAGPQDTWNLAQWGDDLYDFCRALEIEKPIVLGQSFGGMVAISYATRHPEHPGKLIFSSTAAWGQAFLERKIALFTELGGPEVGELARELWSNGGAPELWRKWLEEVAPLYLKQNPDAAARIVRQVAAPSYFSRPGGELVTFDMREGLSLIQCPVLVLGGDSDPVTPIEAQEEIASLVPADSLWRYAAFAGGHGAFRYNPDEVFGLIREFILS